MNTKVMRINGSRGVAFEKLFYFFMRSHGHDIKRADKTNVHYPDFRVDNIYYDTKARLGAIYSSYKRCGISPDEAIMIDETKLRWYRMTDGKTYLVLYVNYRPEFDTRGIYVISADKIFRMAQDNPKRYYYQRDNQRKIDIKCVLFSIKEATDISERFDMDKVEAWIEKDVSKQQEKWRDFDGSSERKQ